MDADFDTGPLLAQGTTPIDDVEDPFQLFERMFTLLGSLLPNALARVEKGRSRRSIARRASNLRRVLRT
jgi:methionyl-tRNA formyltransferase